MLCIIFSLILAAGIVLCHSRGMPPLYTQRIASKKKSFASNDKLTELTKKLKEEREKEREEIMKDCTQKEMGETNRETQKETNKETIKETNKETTKGTDKETNREANKGTEEETKKKVKVEDSKGAEAAKEVEKLPELKGKENNYATLGILKPKTNQPEKSTKTKIVLQKVEAVPPVVQDKVEKKEEVVDKEEKKEEVKEEEKKEPEKEERKKSKEGTKKEEKKVEEKSKKEAAKGTEKNEKSVSKKKKETEKAKEPSIKKSMLEVKEQKAKELSNKEENKKSAEKQTTEPTKEVIPATEKKIDEKTNNEEKKTEDKIEEKSVDKKEEAAATAAPNNPYKNSVAVDRLVLDFVMAGGHQVRRLVNKSDVKMGIKVKLSNPKQFVVTPVFCTCEPGKHVDIEVKRNAGASPAKPDKVVVEWTPIVENEKDVAVLFKKKGAIVNKLELIAVVK